MAKKKKTASKPAASTSISDTRVFLKGMVKDPNASFQAKEAWSHARNAANNSTDGDVGVLGNEPANLECAKIPYTVIGAIHTYGDEWVIYSTDDFNSEIGLFDDSKCQYTTLVNDACLSFNKKHLIIGAAKENFDCTWQVYWDDGNNPSRTMNLTDIPYIQVQTSTPGDDCIIYQDTDALDCEKIRLAPLMSTPCVSVSKSESGGQLRNGTYQVFVAYVVNEQKVTDYIGVSNIQSLFDHDGTAGSLRISITNLDKQFEYYELAILSNNQNNTVAKKIGIYSTEQSSVEIDYIDQSLTSIPLELIPLRSNAYERSDGMYAVNDYLIRQGPTTQFDFNYQPLANKIKAKWVVAEYPADYYQKGGNKTGLMRDEQYAFFIRWIYNTGERSSSYHIPGRAPRTNGVNHYGSIVNETAIAGGGSALSSDEMNFQVFNTATPDVGTFNIPTDDGGIIIKKGDMAYWQSTEKYPATKPEIWDDLCGKYIRHHKMPTEEVCLELRLSSQDNSKIRILGVEFYDIQPPVDNQGNLITNIVGYEILRGSREGHRSILAKGIFRNMRAYKIPDGNGDVGLYPNYPYNDLNPDIFFHDGQANDQNRTDGCDNWPQSFNDYYALGDPLSNIPEGYRKDYFTFHSPELMFRRPFLNAYETRLYGMVAGESEGHFIASENHPKHKLLRNGAAWIAGIIGVGYALNQVQGELTETTHGVQGLNTAGLDSAIFTATSRVAELPLDALGTLAGYIVDGLLDNAKDVADLYTGGLVSSIQSDLIAKEGYYKTATPGTMGGGKTTTIKYGSNDAALPSVIRTAMGFIIAQKNIAIGAQELIDLFYNLVDAESFALKYNSHGFYSDYYKLRPGSVFRTKNKSVNYIGNSFQQFEGYKVNNLFRPLTVGLATENSLPDPQQVEDRSRFAVGGTSPLFTGQAYKGYRNKWLKRYNIKQTRPISAVYGALKFEFENQYGQLNGIKQVQMRGCVELINESSPIQRFSSQPIFSGDTFINRYTEKTIMPIFTDFLNGEPDETPYDYLLRINIPYPRFWMDTRKFDTTALAQEIITLGFADTANTALPNDSYYLDRGNSSCSTGIIDYLRKTDPNPSWNMKYAYMYTHINGVQDFFVESEYNLAHRDWEDSDRKRHYDPYEYTDYDDLFHADNIKDGNFYKYDLSLSPSRLITQLTSFGNRQDLTYDPNVAESCFQHYPKRLIYSLQAQEESKRDFWRVFLPNNYKDFRNKVTTIKPVDRTGALIMFPHQSPALFQGVDLLRTDLGAKLIVGDGGLFARDPQNITNSDVSNEYGSSESARAVLNTPSGIFFISQAQGKVFQYGGGSRLVNIGNAGMKWWFNKYLPSTLIKQFPALETSKLSDNPVIGIGCQVIYDINDDIVYFSKKDYKVKEEHVSNMSFFNDVFTYTSGSGVSRAVKIGDPIYFESTSWTVSYDPKAKAWISFHDWHPDLTLPSINHFLTTKSTVSDTPNCPPGYNFNPSTNECEKAGQESSPATVTVTDIGATVEGGSANCKLDIVIAMDASLSTKLPGNSYQVFESQKTFVQEFLSDSDIAAGMAAGNIQVGFTLWSRSTNAKDGTRAFQYNNQYTMSNTVSYSDLSVFYDKNNIFKQFAGNNSMGDGTDVCAGFDHAVSNILNAKSASQLGDRSSDPDLRSIVLFVTDAKCNNDKAPDPNTCGSSGGTIGGDYLQANPNSRVIAVYSHPDNPLLPINKANDTPPSSGPQPPEVTCDDYGQNLLNAITGDTGTSLSSNQFVIVTNGQYPQNTTSVVADSVSSEVCGSVASCECPPGYTLVYKDSNGNYTANSGVCDNIDPPICRKIDCNCPDPPFVGSTTTASGQCDDLYQVGDPGYINYDPRICNYFYLLKTPPSYEVTGLWRHNSRCDLYSNYYGTDYPWEVEITENTGQNVTTLKSVEYQLESYVYKGNLSNGCADDRWHDLDFNFDESIIYNSEQVSGLLKLRLQPKEDPFGMLQYPIINNNDIEILYSKEEQKYRFNQFWDITDDRGEFSNIERSAFITQLNGYIKDLNAFNLNYAKDSLQRKKFRHYYNKVLLRRKISGDRKMLLKLVNTKLNLSYR